MSCLSLFRWHGNNDIFVNILIITVIATAGCFVGGSTITDTKRINNDSYDSDLDHVPLPIPPKDIPLSLLSASHAELLWLHIRNNLVGNCSQLDSLLCCITCESSSLINPFAAFIVFSYHDNTSFLNLLSKYIYLSSCSLNFNFLSKLTACERSHLQ